MSKKTIAMVPLAGMFLACSACDGISLSYYDRRPVHRRVVRTPVRQRVTRVVHVCTSDCHHHYYDGSRLIALKGHRHGRGCGHLWNGTYWVIVRKGRARVSHTPTRVVVKHVHGPRCGCVYDRRGSKWIVLRKGHVHGPRCGHVHIEGRWSVRIH